MFKYLIYHLQFKIFSRRAIFLLLNLRQIDKFIMEYTSQIYTHIYILFINDYLI